MPRKTSSRGRAAAGQACFNEAAARCRGKLCGSRPSSGRRRASMRPRPDAAENADRTTPITGWRPGFNEAAARCRGKLGGGAGPRAAAVAGFNEAAARCRGKQREGELVKGSGKLLQ